MKQFLKKLLSFSLILLILLMPFSVTAQTLPPMTVTVPANIQVEVDKDFSIPLTIASGANALRVGWVIPTIETPGVDIPSRHINQDMAANSIMNVPLTGKAFSEKGFFRVNIDVYGDATLYGSVSVRNEVMIEVIDPDDVKRPEFKMTQVGFVPPTPDVENIFTVIIDIENFGEEQSGEVTATLDGGVNFYNEHFTNSVILPSVNPGGTARAAFKLRARDNRISNEVELTLKYDNHTQTETVFLPLPEVPDEPSPPFVKVSSFEVERTGEDRFILRLTALNEGDKKARDINVFLDGGERVFIVGGGNIRNIGTLAPNAQARTEYLLTSRGELTNYAVNITFEFIDKDGVKHSSSDRIFISFDLEPDLKIAGFSARPLLGDEEFTLDIQLKNTGKSVARDISVRFTGTQATPLNERAMLNIPDIAAGQTRRLSIRMKASDEFEIYAIPFDVTYRSRAGEEHKLADTIMLSADRIGIETDEYEGLPSLMLDRHTFSVDRVFAGDNFTLSLFIKNTSNEPVGNTRLTIESAAVFSPADNRSSFFIEAIPAYGEHMQEITLFVDQNADEMTYTLPITIQYEDEDGKLSVVSETVVIPVLREGELRVLSLEFPETVALGEQLPISLEIANTGRSVLRNVLVMLEGDFTVENGTYFIPTLEPGTNEFFYATINPETEGKMTGNIIITYTDSADREHRIDNPLSFEVLPMTSDISAMAPNVASSIWIAIVVGVLALVIVAFVVVRRMQGKRKASGMGM